MDLQSILRLLPKSRRPYFTQSTLDTINASLTSDIRDIYFDNFLSYTHILNDSRYKLPDYISAIHFVSHRLLNKTIIDSYTATFPDRYSSLKKMGKTDNEICNYASAYARTELVSKIMEQTIVPTYVLNAPLHQEALNTLAEMIRDPSVKGMAKVKACETILNYTKQPEVVKGELKIDIGQRDTIEELREVTKELAEKLRQSMLEGNSSLRNIAEASIVRSDTLAIEDGS